MYKWDVDDSHKIPLKIFSITITVIIMITSIVTVSIKLLLSLYYFVITTVAVKTFLILLYESLTTRLTILKQTTQFPLLSVH